MGSLRQKMKKKEKSKSQCPYWSSAEQVCRILNEEGLFIPLDDHVEIYCKGPEHHLCRQFALNEQAQRDKIAADRRGKEGDRRHAPRIKSKHRLTFIRLSESGHAICVRPSAANTLDLSTGGMRLTTRELLLFDSLIQFQFTAPFSSSLQTGLAKVEWCKSTEHNMRYQAGLSFQGDHLLQVMNEFLGSQT